MASMFLLKVVADMYTMLTAVCSAYIFRSVQLSEVIVDGVLRTAPSVERRTTALKPICVTLPSTFSCNQKRCCPAMQP